MKWTSFVVIVVLLLASATVDAIEYEYSFFNRTRSSDNISQTEVKSSGYSTNTGVSFEISSADSVDFRAYAGGSFSRQTFSEDGMEDQDYKSLTTGLTYNPRTNNLSLSVIDELSQTPRNRYSSQEVDNLRDTNVFSILSSYFWRLSSLERVHLEYSIANLRNGDVAETEIDGSRDMTDYSIFYERDLNPRNRISLVYNHNETEFKANPLDGAIDFEQRDVFLRWLNQSHSMNIQIELGNSELTDELGMTIDANLSELSIERQINRTNSISFSRQTGFDQVLNTNYLNGTRTVDTNSSDLIGPQMVTTLRAEYTIDTQELDLQMIVATSELDSTRDGSTETRKNAQVRASYPLSKLFGANSNTDVTFDYRRNIRGFNSNATDVTEVDEKLTTLGLSYQHNHNFNFSVGLERRSASEYIGAYESFYATSNSIIVSIEYSPIF